ncbi:hypothetical protein AB0I22_25500 [Streptomyces sp. NPDC050610]|uniref:hypothetical protein n=1 Tax=Streptomyces sp. NPDC050610 TaxID=3157097 RepID=UPI0034429EC2
MPRAVAVGIAAAGVYGLPFPGTVLGSVHVRLLGQLGVPAVRAHRLPDGLRRAVAEPLRSVTALR